MDQFLVFRHLRCLVFGGSVKPQGLPLCIRFHVFVCLVL